MKRLLLVATAVAAFGFAAPLAQAQNPPGGSTAPGGPIAAPNFPAKGTPGAASATDAPPAMGAPSKKHAKRMTMQQRFDAANTTHDGHLTRAQAASANWGYVTKHYDVMDSTHKGYVTMTDIHAYGSAAHAARMQRKAAKPASATAPAPAPATTPPPATPQ